MATLSDVVKNTVSKNRDETINGNIIFNGSLVCGGKNIVQSVNGSTADANGNVTVTISSLRVTDIPAYADLNSYKVIGEYKCPYTADAVTLSNCPIDEAFTMTVLDGANVQQILRQYQGSSVWIRTYQNWNNTWTKWNGFVPTA